MIFLLDTLLQTTSEINATAIEHLVTTLITSLVGLGEKILVAILIYFVGSWLIKMARKVTNKVLLQKHVDKTVQSFINSLVNTVLKIILVIAIIGVLGIQTTTLAAVIAAAGLAIGMAMKDNLSNFAGGVMILMNSPFRIGDYIVAQGVEGTVKEIGILYTILVTGDGKTIYQPNGPLSTGNITNTSTQEKRRIDIVYTINHGNNIKEVKDTITDIVETNKLALKTPAPFVGITKVNNNNFEVTIRVWVSSAAYGTASVQLNEQIYHTLTEKGIFVPSKLNLKIDKD